MARRNNSYGAYAADPRVLPAYASDPRGRQYFRDSAQYTVRRRSHMGGKIVGILFLLLVLAVVGVYVAGSVMFSARFFPNTHMGDLDLSMMKFQDAQALVESVEKDYKLTIEGQGLEIEVTPLNGGVSIDVPAVMSRAKQGMDPWRWPLEINEEHDVSEAMETTLNSSTLGDYITGEVKAFNAEQQPSVDATFRYNEDEIAYEIVPEVYGTQLKADVVIDAAAEAVANMDTTCTIGEDALILPKVYSDDEHLNEVVNKANKMLSVDATLQFYLTETNIATVDAELVHQWVSIDENDEVVLDREAMTKWAEELGRGLTTVGTERTYTRPDGKTITISGGDYGWEADAESVVDLVTEAVDNQTQGIVGIECTKVGNGYAGPDRDWGRYVDVDLTEQYVRYYNSSDEILWESDCISGMRGQHDTPTGVYYLKAAQRDITLIGEIDPETNEPEYKTPVAYWMPFIGNAVGLHDASWQMGAFGNPDAYTYRGSHGCVNLPPDKARELFDMIQIGDCVIVHY